ncbi:hypothetical protein LOZ39_006046 [Ophidiomyces ophidiicola]|uniref:Uncharacterized protein n=1 Tax=Ophidiomyces ophidiicola TaxID=1387563 RepID=A0ACB8UP69_9EURO|nr:uncharacterized protein LOZ57_001353 [Ophidiomyces ophidiicola]KAI1934891.1 hypothetical protein LOZ62_006145 [Ophidiomyces ophidiicola]KAI1951940.1 hypothetical protein LOZ57_001353 [Ophidiomyces ophidiicola]KAI1966462.1 hypothetical protein LOZ56_005706 [Ophidiomyces ophidiicola]KAI2000405.1 hypothetical protein LOZ50_005963 [Ophidiomyces ophidiicola]KAI2031898.1 hypothetical protein LOZ48_002621 [Ophidiomyces ophidiicola]
MEAQVIHAVKIAFEPKDIPFCIVNEAALKYYNVPCVPNSLDICVPENSLSDAGSQLASYKDIFRLHSWLAQNHDKIAADCRKRYLRFQVFMEGRFLDMIVFSDTFCHLDPIQDNIVRLKPNPKDQIRFSRHFDYSIDPNVLSTIPVPRLAAFVQGSARNYLELREDAMAACVEKLVDGMNLDESWCVDHLDTRQDKELQYILAIVATKAARASELGPNRITCIVEEEEEAEAVRMIPGYNDIFCKQDQPPPSKDSRENLPSPVQRIFTSIQSTFLFLIKNFRSAIFGQTALHPVNFQFISDIHLELSQNYSTFAVEKAAPYLILAGDIGALRDYEKYVTFLAAQCAQFDRVFLVLGNHEFYGISHEEGLKAAKKLESEPQLLGKLYLLNRGRVDINRRVTILGCTLWSSIPEESQLWVRMKLADFTVINDWSVEKYNAAHIEDVQWLKQQLHDISLEDEKRDVIVVTHHAPTVEKTSDPKSKLNPWSCAFSTNLIEGQVKSWPGSKNIRRWIFGHTHWNAEFKRKGIIISSNQLGYSANERRRPLKRGLFDFKRPQVQQKFVVTKAMNV